MGTPSTSPPIVLSTWNRTWELNSDRWRTKGDGQCLLANSKAVFLRLTWLLCGTARGNSLYLQMDRRMDDKDRLSILYLSWFEFASEKWDKIGNLKIQQKWCPEKKTELILHQQHGLSIISQLLASHNWEPSGYMQRIAAFPCLLHTGLLGDITSYRPMFELGSTWAFICWVWPTQAFIILRVLST